MPNPSRLTDFSTTDSNNFPGGAEVVGAGLDDYLRAYQGTVRRDLASKGNDVASTTTADVGAVAGFAHDITGTSTITGLGTIEAGIHKVLKFEGALTLTHNATSLILPGGANITTADGDIGWFISEGSGNWRCISYFPATGSLPFVDSSAVVIGSGDKTKKVRFEVDGLTTGTTRVLTVADSDGTLITTGNAAAQGASRVLIATGTASASATLDFTGLDGTYDTLEFDLRNLVPATDAVDFRLRIGTGAGPTYQSGGTDYAFGLEGVKTDAGNDIYANATADHIQLNPDAANFGIDADAPAQGWSGKVYIGGAASATLRKMITFHGGYKPSADAAVAVYGAGTYVTAATAITAVRFLMSSGNIASGTIRLWGLRNS